MTHILDEFKTFLDQSPTSWHAVRQMGNRLALHDFIPLSEHEKWHLELGQKYFVIRSGSLCAFSLPTAVPTHAKILASHTDSPSLKIKPQPEIQTENMVSLGVEIYGSPMLNSWLNRDLGIAGKIVVTNAQDKIHEKLVIIDDAPLFIPQLAIHLERDVNEKGLHLNKQENLNPLLSLETESLETLLRRHHSFRSLLSFDLFLYPLEKSRFLGTQNEWIASYRLDNLASAHACLTALAFAQKPQKELLQMAVFWDHEEIGSRTSEGSASPFLSDILTRIAGNLKMEEEDLCILKNNSLCVCVDMAHALNPNYVKKHDTQHQPLLGKGIVLKYNADQKYASNANSAAAIVHLCQKLNMPYQNYVNRNDIPSGSTVGPVVAATTGIQTVDIGCPELSMHSIREVMAAQDYLDLCRLLTEVLHEGDL